MQRHAARFRLAQTHGSGDEVIIAADKVVAILSQSNNGCIIRTVDEPLFVEATPEDAAKALGFEFADLKSNFST